MLPEPRENWLDKLFELVFGELAPFARTVFHHTTTYIFIAVCIFCAKYVAGKLFAPTDEVADYLHVIEPTEPCSSWRGL
jgi:hypothetical protein